MKQQQQQQQQHEAVSAITLKLMLENLDDSLSRLDDEESEL